MGTGARMTSSVNSDRERAIERGDVCPGCGEPSCECAALTEYADDFPYDDDAGDVTCSHGRYFDEDCDACAEVGMCSICGGDVEMNGDDRCPDCAEKWRKGEIK